MSTRIKNQYYHLEVDEPGGRLSLVLIGEITSLAQVPELITDIQMAVGKLHSGFVALLDIRQVQMGDFVQYLYGQILNGLGASGASKIAEVGLPLPSQFDFNLLIPPGGRIVRMRFLDIDSAEDWLNV